MKTKQLWGRVLVLALYLLLPKCVAATEISGILTSSFYRYKPTSQVFTNIRPFQFSSEGNGIYIRVDPSPQDEGVAYFDYRFDGTNSFSSTQFAVKRERDSLVPRKHPVNDATVVAKPQPYPSPNDNLIIPVWLAFGSSSYFSTLSERYVPSFHFLPPPDLVKRAAMLRFRADWSLSTNAPFLLEWMVDYFAGYVIDGKARRVLPPYYSTGVTNSVFAVTQWTNIDGLSIPRTFSFHEFVPDDNGALKLINLAVGIVTNAASSASVSPSGPVLTDATRIIDYRYLEEVRQHLYGSVPDYVTTNHRFWSVEEIARDAMRRRNLSATDRKGSVSRLGFHYPTLVFGLLIASLPICLVAKLMLARKKQKTNRENL